MSTNSIESSIKKKRMAIIVGVDDPIRIKSREFVIRKLFEKAQKNPFLEAETLDEYMRFLADRIEEVNGEIVDDLSIDNMYTTLKRIGWLREVSYAMFILITASQYAIS